ncbi:MAG: Mut7-C RNAse domain-containing protein [Dissulfuribacterales bacterium]
MDLSDKQKRILLTKNKRLLENKKITRGVLVKLAEPRRQLTEIVNYFDLKTSANPLSLCLRCNGTIEKINKKAIQHRVKPSILKKYDTFFRCTGCDHIYWKGTHFESMMRWVEMVLK